MAWFACARMRLPWLAFLAYFVVGFSLYLHHNLIVDGQTLAGRNSRHERMTAMHEKQFRKHARMVSLSVPKSDDRPLPGGWWDDLPLDPSVRKRVDWKEISAFDRLIFEPLWHTPLTGIASLRRVPRRAWFAGGRLSEAERLLELRDWPGG